MSPTSQQETQQLEWQQLLDLLPPGWEAEAYRLRAFCRSRKVRSPADLLRVVLMHAGAGFSLQRTAEAADQAGMAPLSKIAVWKRLRPTGPWLTWMINGLLGHRVERPDGEGYTPRVVDGTVVCGPRQRSQVRLHYSLRLAELRCDDLVLTDQHQAESLERFAVAAGDLLLADRIYAKARGLAAVKRRGAEVIVRLGATSLTLYDEAGAKMEWLPWLRTLSHDAPAERFAQFRDPEDGSWVRGRVCALRLPPPQAVRAQKRRVQRARRTGAKVRATTLEGAGYLYVFTTVPASRLRADRVLEFYRARWQVELAFKRLKSLLQADQLRETSPASALLWLQGKMLYALLVQASLAQASAFSPSPCGQRRPRAPDRRGRSHRHAGLGADPTDGSCPPSHDRGPQPLEPDPLAHRQHGAGGRTLAPRPHTAIDGSPEPHRGLRTALS
jgi:hypothetical protein